MGHASCSEDPSGQKWPGWPVSARRKRDSFVSTPIMQRVGWFEPSPLTNGVVLRSRLASRDRQVCGVAKVSTNTRYASIKIILRGSAHSQHVLTWFARPRHADVCEHRGRWRVSQESGGLHVRIGNRFSAPVVDGSPILGRVAFEDARRHTEVPGPVHRLCRHRVLKLAGST